MRQLDSVLRGTTVVALDTVMLPQPWLMTTEKGFHARNREWAGQELYAILIFDHLFHPAVAAVVVVVVVVVCHRCCCWWWCGPEHEANTERLITKHTSMRHVEGGWPKDVDFTEQVRRGVDNTRFRRISTRR